MIKNSVLSSKEVDFLSQALNLLIGVLGYRDVYPDEPRSFWLKNEGGCRIVTSKRQGKERGARF